MGFEDDRLRRIFLSRNIFGSRAILDPDFLAEEVNVIFDDEFVDLDALTNRVVSTTPVAHMTQTDADKLQKNSIIEINNVRYVVKEFRPDGTGMVDVFLKE